MAKLTLRGTVLYAHDDLNAATLRQLARWAEKFGSITINDRELTADELEHLARQSEGTGELIYIPQIHEAQNSERNTEGQPIQLIERKGGRE